MAAAFLLLNGAMGAGAAAGDLAGASDYPGLGRFGGSVVTGYEAKAFDSAVIQTKPFRNGKAVDARSLEGKVTRIAYRVSNGASILEVFRN